jgi:hypothetical protein
MKGHFVHFKAKLWKGFRKVIGHPDKELSQKQNQQEPDLQHQHHEDKNQLQRDGNQQQQKQQQEQQAKENQQQPVEENPQQQLKSIVDHNEEPTMENKLVTSDK